ncbi:MAG: hypothetical protein FIA92_07200 [Chloroflexi bacterium]|nr:hypothetical protein [Chloroflexota bacterium]
MASAADAYDGIDVQVETWTSDGGRGYVGVQTAGQWAPPDTRACLRYYSSWRHIAWIGTEPIRDEWFVTVFTCDGSAVNPLEPTMVLTSRTRPGIGVRREASGLLRLDLGVAVEPAIAPAGSVRTVTAALSGSWWDAIGDEISAYVIRNSLRVRRWTVDFGDGTVASVPPEPTMPFRLATTHVYGPGSFEVIVTAHVTGQAYGAFFSPAGIPYEDVIPFAIDITNAAAGISGLPIEYLPPVVVPGGSPSGTLPGGVAIPADAAGHTQIWWPRGLPCDLFIRALVEEEGVMRSGGVVIGGATTRLVSYRYLGGGNGASRASPQGEYEADEPIRIQWNTPLPDKRSYPVRVQLTVETTYDDGTVRTFEFSRSIAATVVFSAISH